MLGRLKGHEDVNLWRDNDEDFLCDDELPSLRRAENELDTGCYALRRDNLRVWDEARSREKLCLNLAIYFAIVVMRSGQDAGWHSLHKAKAKHSYPLDRR